MKKLVSLLLTLGMLFACVPAMADAPIVKPAELPKEVHAYHPLAIFEIEYAGDEYGYRVEKVTADGNVPVTESEFSSIPVLNDSGLTENSSVVWNYAYDGDSTLYDGGNLHQLIVETVNGAKQVFEFYVNYLSMYEYDLITNESILEEDDPDVVQPHKWYAHNTICVDGIPFRDVRPELTNQWYNFAPLDLSKDGAQTFDLVASNMYVIGKVTVTVAGDKVVVDWKLNRQGTNDANFELENEFLTIFPDLNAVTEVEPAKLDGTTYEFGQTISIANDLGGDVHVLLYICNQATYCDNLSYKYMKRIYHPRYWPNLSWRVAQREAMMELVNTDLAK